MLASDQVKRMVTRRMMSGRAHLVVQSSISSAAHAAYGKRSSIVGAAQPHLLISNGTPSNILPTKHALTRSSRAILKSTSVQRGKLEMETGLGNLPHNLPSFREREVGHGVEGGGKAIKAGDVERFQHWA
ncbi:hypothetical protein B0H17DRAFT_1194018 [Mycena rosella]|uniref:Uncharacterized protein n=1 Tax=Mycena rosella TaxID=1033263 RepID=A0AAD7M722_MYCRO|nr:hypothetical protein B0H17DRAFT_1194018 [Mycena rosella]